MRVFFRQKKNPNGFRIYCFGPLSRKIADLTEFGLNCMTFFRAIDLNCSSWRTIHRGPSIHWGFAFIKSHFLTPTMSLCWASCKSTMDIHDFHEIFIEILFEISPRQLGVRQQTRYLELSAPRACFISNNLKTHTVSGRMPRLATGAVQQILENKEIRPHPIWPRPLNVYTHL